METKTSKANKTIKKILDLFLQGMLYTAPLGLTVLVIYWLFGFVDDTVQPLFEKIFEIKIPGLGIVLVFTLITFMGYIGPRLITGPMKALFRKMLGKAPAIDSLYSLFKDFISAFIGKERKFNQPVRVSMSKTSEIERIGFITETDLRELNIHDKVAVYLPYSLSFMGELLIVPVDQVTHIDAPATEVMKFIVSGGVTKF